MKRTVIAYFLALCLLLSGCGTLMDGEFLWEQTHQIQNQPDSQENVSAKNYTELYHVLVNCIENGNPQITVAVGLYDRDSLEADIPKAIESVCGKNPVAAYAVQQIDYELGTGGGEPVLSLQISYLHDQNEIKRIRSVKGNDAAAQAITEALNACDSGIVLRISGYEEADFIQIVEDYALEHPEFVMEAPQVTANIYPQTGNDRVLELKFVYQTSRDTLRNLQTQVGRLFDASVDMVSVTEKAREKYSQMYALLLERFQSYTFETSITPAYSVFVHGVGDSKAFATVYAAMCRRADLECQTVIGSRNGEVWYWNIISFEGNYYHVDLLRCKQEGAFRVMSDSIIDEGYVWNFSAHPACTNTEETDPEA